MTHGSGQTFIAQNGENGKQNKMNPSTTDEGKRRVGTCSTKKGLS